MRVKLPSLTSGSQRVPRRGGGGGLHSQSFVFHFYVLIHPLRFARPPVSGGQSAGAVIDFSFQFVTNSPPETGGVPRSGVGVDVIFVIGRCVQRPYC